MTKAITFADLAEEIERITTEYAKEVIAEIEVETQEAGKQLRELVREGAPVDTGAYKKAIRVTNSKSRTGAPGAVVHVRSPHYRLAHLLEKPHALRGGGRSTPQPHWEPARKKIEPQYIKNIIKKIEGIK